MFTVIIIMCAGIVFGFLSRGRLSGFVRRVITVLIWSLLFLLGVEVGGNPRVVGALGSLGVEAFVVSVAGVLGSAVLAWLLYKYVGHGR